MVTVRSPNKTVDTSCRSRRRLAGHIEAKNIKARRDEGDACKRVDLVSGTVHVEA